MKKRSPRRTNSGQGLAPMVFCDFDGTITQLDVTDQILNQHAHPSWQEAEQEWVRGQIGSRECLERQVALVEASERELNALVDAIPVDPHFAAFYRFARRRGLPLYVLSEGFDYVVRRVLKRAGVRGVLRNGTDLFANSLRVEGRRWALTFPHAAEPCPHGCATCKAAIIRRLRAGPRPVIFVGDGLSDRFAAEEADLVLAKRQLLAYCREKGIACERFETFADVQQAVEKLADSGPPEGRGRGNKRKSKVESRKSRVES